ncbi:MAG: thiamine phosphate synthase [Sarcina sp.]
MRFSERKLYLVTDEEIELESLLEKLENAIKSGVSVVQYRAKNKSTREMIYEANMIKEICRKYRTVFLINDRIDVAIAVNADGVHLGENDMRVDIARSLIGNNKIIGLSVNNNKLAKEADEYKPDYIVIGKNMKSEEIQDVSEFAEENIRILRKKYKGNIYGTYGIKTQIDKYSNENLIDGIIATSNIIFEDIKSNNMKKKIENI